ncbi:hypothetical protein J40TS1_06210 [Paenibacillus montaniterrae]|uniref:Uncharacterized protein n=1 Tax=Paenibacillus montaniterrae TaxID=429341 RepID=A0A920CXE6_9BACL|nr:hypothetical protein [Paenibacillus montaniterrae]GIP14979.1 hypothetical protein J40TS1_06210 [Paenibacillus montaniterrae]
MTRKLLFMFIIIGLLSSCSTDHTNNEIAGVVSNMLITEKGGDDNTGYWIIGERSENIVKIFIDGKSTWDLINTDHMYTVHYGQKSNGHAILYEFELIR